MKVYYIDRDDQVQENELGDVANLAQCERDLDESYDCWSWDKEEMQQMEFELDMYEAKVTMSKEDFESMYDTLVQNGVIPKMKGSIIETISELG